MTDTTHSTRSRLTMTGAAVLCVAAGGVLTACGDEEGSGDLATVTVSDVVDPDVSSLTLLDDFDVDVRVDPAASQSATLRIDDNLLDNTDIWVDDDGELFVGWDDVLVDVEPSKRPVLTVTVRSFEAVENRSDGTVTIDGVDADELVVASSGDGTIRVHGRATTVELDVTADGTVDLAGLVADEVVGDVDADGVTGVRS